MNRLRPLVWPFGLFLFVSLATRFALLFRHDVQVDMAGTLGAMVVGMAYDAVTATYFLALPALALLMLPARLLNARSLRWLGFLGLAAFAFALLLVAVSEWIFWDEFGGRFNFIAVDYLIYTHEVLGNIWESYPVGKILIGLAAVATGVAYGLWRRMEPWSAEPLSHRRRLAAAAIAVMVAAGLGWSVDSEYKNAFASDALDQLAGNGPYEFFAALRANDLDFNRLYWHLTPKEALEESRQLRQPTRSRWRSEDPTDFLHYVDDTMPARRMNVILISVESLGSEFLGCYGDGRDLTPNLDALAKESLVFTRVYATGNRTVRGLEALSLGLPPTPGQSVLKRPHNADLFSLGSVFEDHQYDTLFMYGGYGYFDNMNGFFSANDYRAVDRLAMPKERIHFENIWGIADEDLFDLSIDEIDRSIAASHGSRPVFAHIMTTSNHRPYTYPDGRIDIPSGTGREGAVKYTDWALGHFISEARKHPWFDNTLLVITADHGASARGTSEIPVARYRIPLLIYAPKAVVPARVERVMSQIDIPPTLLGRLNLSYESKFFGQDVMRLPKGMERAFVANYQTLGYLRDGRLVTLLPRQRTRIVSSVDAPPQGNPPLDDATLIREAAAWYESAYLGFRHGYILDEDHLEDENESR